MQTVDNLLLTHLRSLQRIRCALEEADPSCSKNCSDLFLLRFVISAKGNFDKALRHAVDTLSWREKQASLLHSAQPGTSPPEQWQTFRMHLRTDIVGKTPDGDLIFVLRAGAANVHALLKDLKPKVLLDLLMYDRERVHVRLHEETIKTGRLCRMVVVVDLANASLRQFSYTFCRYLAEVSKLSEIYYPQLLHKTVLVNAPSFLMAAVHTIMHLLPKKTREKFVCISSSLDLDSLPECDESWSTKTLDLFGAAQRQA